MELREIVINVAGGLAIPEENYNGLRIVIRDFDIEGADDDEVITLSNGEECTETVYEPED